MNKPLAILALNRRHKMRLEAAKAALTGLLADPTECPELKKGNETCTQATVRRAVEHGDELLKQLNLK